MPVLSDPKHEKFAQLRASGIAQIDAYTQAGFKPHTANASRLEQKVKDRINQLTEAMAKQAVLSRGELLVRVQAMMDADLRRLYNQDGTLKPIHELDDDTARALTSLEVEQVTIGRGRAKRKVAVPTKVRRVDPRSAADLYGRLAGYMSEDQSKTLTPMTLNDLVMQSLQVNVTVNVGADGQTAATAQISAAGGAVKTIEGKKA